MRRRRGPALSAVALCACLLAGSGSDQPACADTIVRLALWVDPTRHAEFAADFDSLIAPRLAVQGLVALDEAPPPAPDSVFSALYSLPDQPALERAYAAVTQDSSLLADLLALAQDYGTHRARYLTADHLWQVVMPMRIEAGAAARTWAELADTVVALGPGQPYDMGAQIGRWRTYDATGGLRSGTVLDLLQDRDGNMWFATWGGGVARFDGEVWQTWSTQTGLPSDVVTDLFEDSRGRIWVATGGPTEEFQPRGVASWDGTAWTTYTRADGLATDNITTIGEDAAGGIWFGACGQVWASVDQAVSRWDGVEFQTWAVSPGLPSDCAWDIDRDGLDRLCLATPDGLSCHDGDAWHAYPYPGGRAGAVRITRAPDGHLWGVSSHVESGETHLWRFDGDRYRERPMPTVSPWWLLIAVDRSGGVWVGGLGGTEAGLYRVDGETWVPMGRRQGLVSDRARAVLQDREGYIWVGTSVGVSRWDPSVTAFQRRRPLNEGGALAVGAHMIDDGAGGLWMGSWGEGLLHFDGTAFRSFGARDGLVGQHALALAVDGMGGLWFGGTDEAIKVGATPSDFVLSRLAGGSVATFAAGPVSQLEVGPGGDLWMLWGYSNTLVRRRLDGTRVYSIADGLPDSRLVCLILDGRGRPWVGTAGAGVVRLDSAGVTRFSTADGLAHNSIWTAFRDREGRLWFGTDGGGVSCYDDGRWSSYGPAEGLAGTWVTAIAQDRRGHMWFATAGGGVSRFDGEVFQTLTQEDGLSTHFVHAIHEDGDGNLWLAGLGDITRLRPQAVVPPPVWVDAVVTDHRHVSVDELSVASTVGLVTFEFHGISHKTRPGAMVYRYRLDGHDEDWRLTRERSVTYADLPRGDYTFEVGAVDRDLVRSETPARVRLYVHVSYERVAWLASLTLALGLVAWQTTRVVRRDRRLITANRELVAANEAVEATTRNKSEFLRRMSHDLRSPMNAIMGYTRLVLRKARGTLDARQVRNLENIQTSSEHLLALINDILDLSRIEAGRLELHLEDTDLRQLVDECVDALVPLVQPGVELGRDLQAVPPLRTDAERLRQVVTNLLGNAVKFTEAGRIDVSLRAAGVPAAGVELRVADTGVGIPPEDLPHIFDEFRQVQRQGGEQVQGTGLGLSIARRIVELLGGRIEAESEVGSGTVFTVQLPAEYPESEEETT